MLLILIGQNHRRQLQPHPHPNDDDNDHQRPLSQTNTVTTQVYRIYSHIYMIKVHTLHQTSDLSIRTGDILMSKSAHFCF